MACAFKTFLIKNQSWFWTQSIAFIMGVMLLIAPTNWKILTPYSAYCAVTFLVITLALNPLKALKPQWVWIKVLNRYRRMLGVAAFSCATIHVLCFVIKRGGPAATLPYLFHPALISVAWIALPIFFLMALTSNNYSVKKLGFSKWQSLHNKVYFAEAAIIVHMIMVDESTWALIIFSPLILLQIFRQYQKNFPNIFFFN